MFDRLTNSENATTAGALAEALFYYGRTNMVVTGGTLPPLVREFGFENLIRCIDMGVLELSYERQRLSVLTAGNAIHYHGFGTYELAGDNNGRKVRGMADDIELALSRTFGNTDAVRQQAKAIVDRTKQRGQKSRIKEETIRDILDREYFSSSVRQILSVLVPDYKLPAKFHATGTNTAKGLLFSSSLDFREANRIYHLAVSPKDSSIDAAYILSHILDARKELAFAAEFNSDLWLTPAVGAVLRNKVNLCAARLDASREQVELFQKVEFEGKSIKEAIDGRERSIAELIALLEDQEFRRFQSWLRHQPPGCSLLREYHRAVFGRNTPFNGTVSKLVQIFAFTGLGTVVDVVIGSAGLASTVGFALGASASVGVGLGQEFFLPRLLEGWQPNQFINRSARRFLSPRAET